MALPAVPGWSPGRVHSGHAAQPPCARGNTLAGHVALSEASGEITLAGLAAHSGLPGGSITHSALGFFREHVAHSQAFGIVSLAGLHGALGSFREGCVALGGFRGNTLAGLAAHSDDLPGKLPSCVSRDMWRARKVSGRGFMA